MPLLSLDTTVLGWLLKNQDGRCIFGRSKWSFMGKSKVHKRPCMGNFPCTNTVLRSTTQMDMVTVETKRFARLCERGLSEMSHSPRHTSPGKHNLERLFFIYRLCRKQSPTEHLMRLLDCSPPLRLKEAQMVCKEQCFSTEHSRKTRQNYQTIIYENVKHQKYHKEAPF